MTKPNIYIALPVGTVTILSERMVRLCSFGEFGSVRVGGRGFNKASVMHFIEVLRSEACSGYSVQKATSPLGTNTKKEGER